MSLKLLKEGSAAGAARPVGEDMELINAYARRALEPEEVYTFSLILCDNDIDRDLEAFSEETLAQLGELFLGKTGISDHDWSAGRQFARIYKTQVVHEPGKKTADGRDYAALKAWAYMLRTEASAGLIAEIDGGIKKECSVGCSVAERRCSVCGESTCDHVKGQTYGGRLCYQVLSGAVDAYEWSFVAVPAQVNAGVTKALGGPGTAELKALTEQARLGREYMELMRAETKRLSLICGRELFEGLEKAVDSMDPDSLKKLKKALESRVGELMPIAAQLPGTKEQTRFDGEAYIV